ncbi:MAG: CHRD domain-containing protein [Ferruginibacter sp.]|nr:CHRD domain-containing protein [Chitinophagaceae bacterium]
MKLIKLTALPLLFIVFVLGITSCEKNAEKKKTTDYEKKNIPLTGAQETPANPSSALGSMDVFYSKETRILSYTVRWSGLTDSVMLMHIHGLAPTGFAAGVVQNIIITATNGSPGNGIFAQKTTAGRFNFAKSGTITASLLADGVFVKEQDILNGSFYMNIHTATYPSGEIRGQITFQ